MATVQSSHNQTESTPASPANGSRRRAGTPAERLAEASLVARAQRGEKAAMEQILATHRGRIERLTGSILRNSMDAEEVVQDVLVAVTNKIDRFRGEANLSTWIHRIAVNAALMHKRRNRSGRSVSLDEARPAVEDRDSSEARTRHEQSMDPSLRQEVWHKVWNAVDDLDDKYRSVFILRDVEGLSTEEAARTLGLKIPAVKSRLHRARNSLRQSLGEYFDRQSPSETALAA